MPTGLRPRSSLPATVDPGTSFTDTGLTAGTACYYVVTAASAVGTDAYSAQAFATPLTQQEAWRLANFGTTANSGDAADAADAADTDGDGTTNAQEYISGTDPTSAASVLKVTDLTVDSGSITISFPTLSGKTYRLERSLTLQSGSWTTVQDNIAGTGGMVQITDFGADAQPKRFYRIILIP